LSATIGSTNLAKISLPEFKFLHHEAAGGVVLVIATILAMAVANSPAATLYNNLLETRVTVGSAPLVLTKTVLHWINDGLMAVFFFLIGLEIKREFLAGALSSPKTAALPAIAAIGGMLVPAAIYAAINWDNPVTLRGWAIPAATDIAFAVGVLALLGKSVPSALKVFVLALAIIDDLGAIIVIALFYATDLSVTAITLAAAGTLLLYVLNRRNVTHIWAYLLVGLFVWVCVLKSGVHATLAGVITALSIPLAAGSAGHEGPLEKLEHTLGPWVSFGILPLFAFANAGVSMNGLTLADLAAPVPLGIALGLFIGKPVGIYSFAHMAISSGLASMPQNTTRLQLFGASALAGIGFTMSLFIGMLAFTDPAFSPHVRLGVLTGSLLSGLAGFAILYAARNNR
jgi:Na+:H+ antiporter, NhaA family